MSFAMFAITKSPLDDSTIHKLESRKINITDLSPDVKEGTIGHYYYEISNEISPVRVNPYTEIEEMHGALKSFHEKGDFKLLVVDENQVDKYINTNHDGNFDKSIQGFPQEKVDLNELLDRYPHMIDTNKMYIID